MLCSLFMGCSIIDSIALKSGYKNLNKANVELKAKQDELSQVKLDSIKAINDAKDQVAKQKDAQYNQLYDNFTNTSTWVYGVWISAQLNKSKYPSRLADIMFLKSDSALKFSLGPTKEAIIAQNQSLVDELNEQKTTNAQLQAKYDKVAQDAQISQEKLKDDDLAVINAQKNADKIKSDKQAEIDAKQRDVDAAQIAKSKAEDEVRASQAKSLADIKKEEKFKIYMIGILMTVALAAGAAAIFAPLPLLKPKLALFAIVAFGAAMAIPFLQAWMVLIPLGLVVLSLLIVGGFMLYNFIKERETAGNTYSAIEEFKNEAPQEFAKLSTKLSDWQSKITTDAKGIITKTIDPAVSMIINNHLVEKNVK